MPAVFGSVARGEDTDTSDIDLLVDFLPGASLVDEFIGPAVERFIEVLGEAARQLSEERRAQYPEVNWTEIIGLRTRLAHIYHRIDNENIWGTATIDVPKLVKNLTKNS